MGCRAATSIQIRGDHGRGAGFGDTIEHDLDGVGPHPPDAEKGPSPEQVGDLLGAPIAIPPQGARNPRREGAVAGRGQVGVRDIGDPGGVAE
ncbi:hypothetical protein Pd630_LPD04167 [Rhodococcus opacus PD630]|nr:hypothetical protein Pd630_LPD04167 [Rhodococcus opacus PD630]